jgi:hypothetical protein
MDSEFPGQTVTMSHLSAFMIYRVLGYRSSESDPFSGTVQLSTFLTADLGPLVLALRQSGRIAFIKRDLTESDQFKERLRSVRLFTGEAMVYSHARPIFPQDEARLRAVFTRDTASIRDEAVLIVLLRSGFRAQSMSLMRRDLHAFARDGSVQLTIPNAKTSNQVDARIKFRGEDAEVLLRWISRRGEMYPTSPFLFINREGRPLTPDSINVMLSKLSSAAGYGEGFFTSHSCRSGFANRIAAQVYSAGGTQTEIRERLCDGRNWKIGSKSVDSYVQPNLRNHFVDGSTLRDFESLDPAIVHDLEDLEPILKRPLDWFHHSEERLSEICSKLGVRYIPGDQEKTRNSICFGLMQRSGSLREFIEELRQACGPRFWSLEGRLVGVLLEAGEISPLLWTDPVHRAELFECLVAREHFRAPRPSIYAQQTVVHSLLSRDQADWISRQVLRRQYDRKVHLGKLPDGNLVLLRCHANDSSCKEAQLPPFDLNLHFPIPETLLTPPNLVANGLSRNPPTRSTAASSHHYCN